ncbi:hypothetical protein Mgra_00009054 [Meloidogyne graminicola]|uniref:BAG domain-containing protein n=1 Tax=Meloidogyne graminicola TaxID=189291 RepID=A0A8S9ZDY3_9BILA|nr:hypothetical protein Mgra_00009054 [Meloidogyne graminicola]
MYVLESTHKMKMLYKTDLDFWWSSLEKSNVGRIGGPRKLVMEDFFGEPFGNFNPRGSFQRRFTERGLFDDNEDDFFDDSFSRSAKHNSFRENPNLFHSLPRRQNKAPGSITENCGVERPIPIKVNNTAPQCKTPNLRENEDYKFGNIHRIPIRQFDDLSDNQEEQKLVKNNIPAKYEHNLPGKVRRFSPADKRSRFSNKNEQNYTSNSNNPIPNIVIDDYGDGTIIGSHEKSTAIPLPAPAIPLPAPQQKNNAENEPDQSLCNIKSSEEFEISEDDYKNKEMEVIVASSDNHTTPLNNNIENLLRLLDDTERKLTLCRENASSLEQEKESILKILKNIKLTDSLLELEQVGDRDELVLNVDRIITRCSSVDVFVNTPRDKHQNQALKHVNEIIYVALNQTNDTVKTKTKIQGFLNACRAEESGHIDDKFQSLIIACTADDQKNHEIRRRLEKIIVQLEQTQQLPLPDLI